MAAKGPWRQFTLDVQLAEVKTHVDVQVEINNITTCNFFYLRHNYTFRITKWSGGGYWSFMEKFLPVYAIDAASRLKYGEVQRDPATGNEQMVQDQDQRVECLMQATKDIFDCLNDIIVKHQRSVVDYALWYREKQRDDDTYSHLITLVTCHCIVHSDFMYGNVNFDLVKFTKR